MLVREPDRSLTIEQQGFVDTVVWIRRAIGRNIARFAGEGYRRYVCVEAAMADTAVSLIRKSLGADHKLEGVTRMPTKLFQDLFLNTATMCGAASGCVPAR